MNEMGHRYHCPSCGSDTIVTKPGEGALMCCERPMEDLTQNEIDAVETQSSVGVNGPDP